MIKRIGAFLILASVAACSSPPERKTVPVENVTFRLGQTKDGVEVRLESGFYPSSGYELQAAFEGRTREQPMDAKALAAGVTVLITPTLVPLEEHGARAPAAALLFLPVGNVDGVAWPLLFKLAQGGATRLDPYTVEHKGGGWLLSRPQGGFSKYEAQGSY
jgi:hypothetical protein